MKEMLAQSLVMGDIFQVENGEDVYQVGVMDPKSGWWIVELWCQHTDDADEVFALEPGVKVVRLYSADMKLHAYDDGRISY